MRLYQRLLILCCFGLQLSANPFLIQYPNKEVLTDNDYLQVQEKLRTIDIRPLIKQLYPGPQGYTSLDDFYNRCSRGLTQVLTAPEKGLSAFQRLEMIGHGSDMCIVCCAPFDGNRSELIKSISGALKATGFNGFFLWRLGGFPNPTGREIQYAGVPYCFKIFMMLEAQKLGFDKVLWIDSAALPLLNPTPLFQSLNAQNVLMAAFPTSSVHSRYIFPATRDLLLSLTHVDVLHMQYVPTIVFGLKLSSEIAQRLIGDFYYFVELGTPFLSCFPEEFVISAIMGQRDMRPWQATKARLLAGSRADESPAIFNQLRKEGVFFYHRKH